MLAEAGVDTCDLAAVLRDRADREKMFYQTDEVITDLAYYYMYCEIVSRLEEMETGYKKAFLPIRPESFVEYTMPVTTGNHSIALGFEASSVTENVTRLKYSNSKKMISVSDGSKIYFGDDGALPTAVIVCDDSSEPLVNLLTEHFRYSYVLPKNQNVLPDDVIESVRPDYVIYLCNEGSISFAEEY